ncbi:MAG: hypothetical protein JWM98_1917 [Thermoleophilia bacterium]|nr:hypothetical protein [Thermoleophilia bacterium]
MANHFDTSHRSDSMTPNQGSAFGTAQTLAGRQHPADIMRSMAQLEQLAAERLPDAAERAKAIGVTEQVEAAWHEGRMLPVLRARARRITELLERPTGPAS